MVPLIGALLQLAPAAIRLLGNARGGKYAEVGDKVAEFTESVAGLPKAQQEQALQEKLSQLSPEGLQEVLTLEADAKARIEEAQQATAREREVSWQTQLKTESLSAKKIRPTIAKQSWTISAIYAILTTIVPTILELIPSAPSVSLTFSWTVFAALFSPAGVFMGIRGAERWKAGGTP